MIMKTQNSANLSRTQHAVQLVGPDKLVFNRSKEVFLPIGHQILCRVEAVGLCFSDLKLLKQFSSHVRKGAVVSGIDAGVLNEIPSYVPGEAATVPGHETVIKVEAVGTDVKNFKPGCRFIIQADYRWLHTAGSNAAFGYNFEGALQEYVLMDERIMFSPQGGSMLIPVSGKLSASAAALIEPWACVENDYANSERRKLKPEGRILVVADVKVPECVLANFFNRYGNSALEKSNITEVSGNDISELAEAGYDDVIYFGSDPAVVEILFEKVSANGLLNIVLCGSRFGRGVSAAVGRVHYGGIRIVGTTGSDPAESMEYIPKTGEVRAGDKLNVVGAAGPMGTMHVIRNICQGIEGISIFAGDQDESRLAALSKKAEPLAKKHNVRYQPYNPTKEKLTDTFNYTVLMVPVSELVNASVKSSARGGIIDIFAGLPATVTAELDLDAYIEKQLYFVGTSGSVPEDMEAVLVKTESGQLDTNISVGAVCGLDSAIDGIRAVENRSIAGKIIVYPACKGLGLTRLEKLQEKMPQVAECLNNGLWTKQAEEKLLASFK